MFKKAKIGKNNKGDILKVYKRISKAKGIIISIILIVLLIGYISKYRN